jgi:hypothetical protein
MRGISRTIRLWPMTLLGSAVTLSDIVALSGNDGDAVTLVPHGAADLFGAAVEPAGQGILFVNDGTNALDLASVR